MVVERTKRRNAWPHKALYNTPIAYRIEFRIWEKKPIMVTCDAVGPVKGPLGYSGLNHPES